MLNEMGTLTGQGTNGRILFTGNGNLIIGDLMGRIPESYQVEKCLPLEANFEAALKKLSPHAVVVCLSDESKNTLSMYSSLGKNPFYYNMPIIAIGSEEDCTFFRENVFLENMHFFVRPLDTDAFLETLNQCTSDKTYVPQAPQPARKIEAPPPDQSELAAAVEILEQKIENLSREYGKKTILVVDDDVTMLTMIQLFLEDLYNVVALPNGKLAIKYLSKNHADLVLLDYMMPEEDGPAILQQIRDFSPQPDIPVIFLTGVADKDLVLHGLEFHPNGYLLKPVSRGLLLEKMAELLLGL